MGVAVRITSPEQALHYSQYLSARPHVHLTQSSKWPLVKANWGVERFLCYREGSSEQVQGTAQLLHITDAKTGQGFAYIPRGPVCDSPQAARELLGAALDWARQSQIHTLRVDPEWIDSPQAREDLEALAALAPEYGASASICRLPEHPAGQPPIEVVGTLPGGSYQDWFMALPSRRRGVIRKGLRRGVEAYSSSERDLIEPLFRLLVATAERQGISHRPKEYFYGLYDAFIASPGGAAPAHSPLADSPDLAEAGTDVFFSVGNFEGQIVSISMNVVYKDTIYWLYVGNDLDIYNLNASTVTTAETFQEAERRSISHINLGGAFSTDPQQCGLMYFKSQLCSPEGARVFVGEIDFHL